MTLRFHQFEKIKDFCSFQKYIQTFSTKYSVAKIDLQNTAETFDNDFKPKKPNLLTRREFQKIQTSFDKDFLLQHLAAFDFKIEIYVEQMTGRSVSGKSPFLRQDIFPKKMITFDVNNQLQEYLFFEGCLIPSESRQTFMEELRQEEKLCEFLESVCLRSCDQVANEIIFMVSKICQHYSVIRNLQYTYQKLLQQSRNLTESLYVNVKNHPHIKYFTFENTLMKPVLQVKHQDQEIKKIIEFLILTIFLILSHQFANPFYQQKISSQLKRHHFFNNYTYYDSYQDFSEEQDEEGISSLMKGRKKIK